MQIQNTKETSVLPKSPAVGRKEQVKKTSQNKNRGYNFRNKGMDAVKWSNEARENGKGEGHKRGTPPVAQPVYGAPGRIPLPPTKPDPDRGGAQPVYGAPYNPNEPRGGAQPVYGAPYNPNERGPVAQPVYGAPAQLDTPDFSKFFK